MVSVADNCSGGTDSQNYAVSELERELPQLSSLFTKIPPPPPPVKQEQISSETENDESFKHEEEEIKPAVNSAKEEIVHGGGRGFAAVARPMEGLSEAGPPPFLKKTFEMVDDGATDGVVSWSESRDSFVVWDSHEFSKNLLPKYFKHSNFSSFIRQLNTYGFKKVDPDRWEFANSGFKGGKRHLLKNIKRRSKYSKNHRHGLPLASDSPKPLFDAELDSLKHDQDSLRVEISKIRQEHKDSRRQIAAMEERLRSSECRQSQMMAFLMKTVSSPEFVRQLIQRRDRRRELDGNAVEIRKRKRISSIATIPDSETDQSVMTENLADGTQFSTESYSSLFHDREEVKESSGCSDVFSENLVDEISILDEELSVSDSKFYNELEDLVEKPRDYWGAYMTSLVEQTCFELRG